MTFSKVSCEFLRLSVFVLLGLILVHDSITLSHFSPATSTEVASNALMLRISRILHTGFPQSLSIEAFLKNRQPSFLTFLERLNHLTFQFFSFFWRAKKQVLVRIMSLKFTCNRRKNLVGFSSCLAKNWIIIRYLRSVCVFSRSLFLYY